MALRSVGPHLLTNGRDLLTENLTPGASVYGERLVREAGREYRVWNPMRSKLAALLHKGFRDLGLKESSTVLYLGAATGTTVSHLSDMLTEGAVHAVEVSPQAFRKLLELSRMRQNVLPILGDAAHPEAYWSTVGRVDLLYQDVAQRDQAGILMRNLPLLKPHGRALLMVKARSIDVAEKPAIIYRRLASNFKGAGLEVVTTVDLAPFEVDHACMVLMAP